MSTTYISCAGTVPGRCRESRGCRGRPTLGGNCRFRVSEFGFLLQALHARRGGLSPNSGGELTVDDRDGGGAVFSLSVCVPLADDNIDAVLLSKYE